MNQPSKNSWKISKLYGYLYVFLGLIEAARIIILTIASPNNPDNGVGYFFALPALLIPGLAIYIIKSRSRTLTLTTVLLTGIFSILYLVSFPILALVSFVLMVGVLATVIIAKEQ